MGYNQQVLSLLPIFVEVHTYFQNLALLLLGIGQVQQC
jgi:hypothetical protein